jgi:hypothetical protein
VLNCEDRAPLRRREQVGVRRAAARTFHVTDPRGAGIDFPYPRFLKVPWHATRGGPMTENDDERDDDVARRRSAWRGFVRAHSPPVAAEGKSPRRHPPRTCLPWFHPSPSLTPKPLIPAAGAVRVTMPTPRSASGYRLACH